MLIVHKILSDGISHSLGFVSSDNEGRILSVVQKGEHRLGRLRHNEEITIISGKMIVNGYRLDAEDSKKMKKGEELVITAIEISSFMRKTIGRV